MTAEAFAPNLLVGGALILLAALSPSRTGLARAAFAAIAITASLRYLWWRWTDTLPSGWSTAADLFVFGCFIFELLLSFNALTGMVVLSRTIDRRAQADDNEAWARAQPADQLPSVDVLIPTYNEERDVLERTIIGAVSLDYPNFTVWVLDDGRRPWLEELAASKGARYLTRADNAHAKAGNINAALARTSGDLVLVLDADFVARHGLLQRVVGFFRDPQVAIVQTPQYFFNKDPVQTNLRLADRWADDQRLFFDCILPSRDAWGAAFCCGTGCVMRRSALAEIGGGIPTQSICEDMLTSMALTRRGLRTIYLREELCIGLAPESVSAYFVQRTRWARGQVQILYLRNGIWGRGLPLFYRLLFLPGYWLLQLPARIFYTILPVLYLLTGLAPLIVRDFDALLGHLGPSMIGSIGLIWWVGRACYFPILTDATNLFMAIRVAPAALLSIVKPFGVPFRVTPKGAAANQGVDRVVFWGCLGVLGLTLASLLLNVFDDWRAVADRGAMEFATFWAILDAPVLGLAALIARDQPFRRGEERFTIGAPARIQAGGAPLSCIVDDLSLSGCLLRLGDQPLPEPGRTTVLSIPPVGEVEGLVVRASDGTAAIRFVDLPDAAREAILAASPRRTRGPQRAALRFQVEAPARMIAGGAWAGCTIGEASLAGANLAFSGPPPVRLGDPLTLELPEAGPVSARVVRATENRVGIAFEDVDEATRDGLIRWLYALPHPVALTAPPKPWALVATLLRRLLGPDVAEARQ